MTEKIPVFLASDENYAPFLCTAMYSILSNTNNYISFYVMDGGIKEKSKKLICESLDKFFNFSIKYFDMKNFNLERFPNIKHYSLNTFSRYFIPQLTPELEKIIYIDVDVIVRGDISQLYNIDLENNAIVAVPENFYLLNGKYVKEHVKSDFENVENYFNAGVMLLNNKQFVENNYSEKLINLTIELYDKLSCPDQDIFNIMFEHNNKLIDYKFNYMAEHKHLYNKLNPILGDRLDKQAIIIHYTAEKPWKNKNVRLAEEFWNVINETKFKQQVKHQYNKINQKSLLEKIFSIKNQYSNYNNKHKVITILGVKIKIKVKNII